MEFGVEVEFDDVEPPADKMAEYGRQKVPSYEMQRATIDMGFQV